MHFFYCSFTQLKTLVKNVLKNGAGLGKKQTQNHSDHCWHGRVMWTMGRRSLSLKCFSCLLSYSLTANTIKVSLLHTEFYSSQFQLHKYICSWLPLVSAAGIQKLSFSTVWTEASNLNSIFYEKHNSKPYKNMLLNYVNYEH